MWPRWVSTTLGAWLLACPLVFRQLRVQSLNDVICGLLAIAFAVTGLISGRPTRLLNLGLGCWLIVSALFFPHARAAGAWNQGIVGYLLMMFGSIPSTGHRVVGPTAPVNW
jgi:hypothetical protein